MQTVNDAPQQAPANYVTMNPCVEISGHRGGMAFPEYTGSGIPLDEHPFEPGTFSRWSLNTTCGACGSSNTLCIYLYYVGGVGTGQDMVIELVCQDCGKYTLNTYIA